MKQLIVISFCCAIFNGTISAMPPKDITANLVKNISGFFAKAQGNSILLSWGTISEYDRQDFSVQRSTDEMVWNDVTIVHGMGGSLWPVSYCYVDTNVYDGIYYYRVKINMENVEEYSEIISVKYNRSESEPLLYSVYPNPTKSTVWIKPTEENISVSQLVIYNTKGEQVYSAKAGEGIQAVDMSDFKPGCYYLKTGMQMHRIYKE
jgi:hypothetical protein